MFEKYTHEARRTVFYARYEASEFGSDSIRPEHFLLGLLRDKDETLSQLFPATVTAEDVRRRVEAEGGAREKLSVSVEHLLLGLLRAEGTLAETVLRERGVELSATREKVGATSTGAASSGRERQSRTVPAGREMPLRVEHIGIATRSIEEALGFWRDALGLEVRHTETVEEQGVNVAMLPAGEPRIELLEPTGPDSPVAKFLEKRGPGIHHVAVRVADIRAALARMKTAGARLIDEEPRVGAGGCLVAFVHPSASGGVLLELVQHMPAESGDTREEG
jgi:methylmalonyl-CoA epimerase